MSVKFSVGLGKFTCKGKIRVLAMDTVLARLVDTLANVTLGTTEVTVPTVNVQLGSEKHLTLFLACETPELRKLTKMLEEIGEVGRDVRPLTRHYS